MKTKILSIVFGVIGLIAGISSTILSINKFYEPNMERSFTYKGYRFVTTVQLNTTVQQTPRGDAFSKITINHTGEEYYHQKKEVFNEELIEKIVEMENDAKVWAENLETPKETELQKKLKELGFI